MNVLSQFPAKTSQTQITLYSKHVLKDISLPNSNNIKSGHTHTVVLKMKYYNSKFLNTPVPL